MATYVGKWDCPACGTKRIPGWKDGKTVERCPACGGPSSGKWYLDDRSMVIADPEEVALAKSKRAWTCGHCGHTNDAADSECDSCGNPKDEQSGDLEFQSRRYQPGEEPNSSETAKVPEKMELGGEKTWECIRCNSTNPDSNEKCGNCGLKAAFSRGDGGWEKKGMKRKLHPGIKIFLIALGSVFAILVAGFWPVSTEVQVDSFAWERNVSIEDYAERSRSDWDYPPTGAYNVTSREEVHHYDQVFSHTECNTETYVCGTIDNGNGTFSDEYCTEERCTDIYDDVPVYATRYYYNIMDWAQHHVVEASGEDHVAVWPKDPKTTSSPGTWREGGRSGTYFTYVAERSGRRRKVEMEHEKWQKARKGDLERGKKAWLFGVWYGFE